jgi:uncharacterized protein
MLGRLARMLRLLGYDTLFSPEILVTELREVAEQDERILLTRGRTERRFPGVSNVYSVPSEYPPEQLRQVVQRFRLDTQSGLWTRCTLCNGGIKPAEKASVSSHVEPHILDLYDEFFRCKGCGHIYWKGSHTERILKNLALLL